MNAAPIVVEQEYSAAPADVWRAITEAEQMRKWFFEPMQEFRPEVGFETEFIVEVDGTKYPHQWQVREVVPEQRIAYGWRYGGFPGDSTVVWELSQTEAGTRLVLTHQWHQEFPADQEVFSRESCQGGWEYFLQNSLKKFLEQ